MLAQIRLCPARLNWLYCLQLRERQAASAGSLRIYVITSSVLALPPLTRHALTQFPLCLSLSYPFSFPFSSSPTVGSERQGSKQGKLLIINSQFWAAGEMDKHWAHGLWPSSQEIWTTQREKTLQGALTNHAGILGIEHYCCTTPKGALIWDWNGHGSNMLYA